ncbi:MAG: 30S ribosomal protein S7 [Clostridiales bacterium]|nr:30S ribosomal protein S7 [Clostridiales bacterium]
MSRRKAAERRVYLPDAIYESIAITRFINGVMKNGKKNTAQTIVYGALKLVEEKTEKDPLEVFEKALNNIMPVLEIKSRRVGGANYQVPIEVRSERKFTLGIRWLVTYAKKRSEKVMIKKLAGEVIDASNGTGGAVKKREDVHKMAEANKAFAHYRW